jgi:hypothetical protein
MKQSLHITDGWPALTVHNAGSHSSAHGLSPRKFSLVLRQQRMHALQAFDVAQQLSLRSSAAGKVVAVPIHPGHEVCDIGRVASWLRPSQNTLKGCLHELRPVDQGRLKTLGQGLIQIMLRVTHAHLQLAARIGDSEHANAK